MAFTQILLITSLLGIQLQEIYGHGMMMDPVQRSSAWRKGFPVEPNYDDMGLYCGGYNVQWEQNGGRCGILRIPYKRGETININVKLTANHKGSFTFHLCPLHSSNELETEDCFNRYPLQLSDGSYSLSVPSSQYEFNVGVRLPGGVTCNQCVVRWNYRSGNNWGDCGDGHSALGCGPQETFRNCADVAIS
ncbi:PREDICTED: uncharacterized protein LOC107194583 [Dufourea novaeangliae]|uniref:uncharacterized protein LOC107194583 n=1 Tax=Dufourea novaeangliae TaxID=178035 RepID=UPI000767344C|nr:PREDICTED: uncharacterized protein LOC107194583 [Dufourea novaeangliae]